MINDNEINRIQIGNTLQQLKKTFIAINGMKYQGQKNKIIRKELSQANIVFRYVNDNLLIGEILFFTLERRNESYRIYYRNNKLDVKVFKKLIMNFSIQYNYSLGIDYLFCDLDDDRDDDTYYNYDKSYVKINNQFTLNLFTEYIKKNEDYIRINTL